MRFLLLPLLLCAGALPAPAAAAAPSPNPFAGSYEGYVPVEGSILCAITISADGKVSGTGGSPIVFYQVVSGTVSKAGRMSCTVTSVVGGLQTRTKFQASVTLDAAGNIVGTANTGVNFTWYRL